MPRCRAGVKGPRVYLGVARAVASPDPQWQLSLVSVVGWSGFLARSAKRPVRADARMRLPGPVRSREGICVEPLREDRRGASEQAGVPAISSVTLH